jgi:hypothetical protein
VVGSHDRKAVRTRDARTDSLTTWTSQSWIRRHHGLGDRDSKRVNSPHTSRRAERAERESTGQKLKRPDVKLIVDDDETSSSLADFLCIWITNEFDCRVVDRFLFWIIE